ncbi:MAG: sialate O-acetylesterase [Bacteroidota bacterium]|nr:sialate O-acetylesterase [Bacteroidota bacterium]
MKNCRLFRRLGLVFLWIFVTNSLIANVSLPKIFGDNMVLQANKTVTIWGRAAIGEPVVVTFRNQVKKTVANTAGQWAVKLSSLQASEKPETMIVSGFNTIRVENILVGEVWVCSGQSNMEFPLAKSVGWRTGVDNYEQEVAAANYPEIRLFIVKKYKANEPQTDCDGEWKVCSPENVKDFSAVGYYFGHYLHKQIRKPVGMIQSAYGGTHAELWTKMDVMANNPLYDEVLNSYEVDVKKYNAYQQALKLWNEKTSNGKNISANTPAPISVTQPSKPACLWNGMIQPIIPFTIKGVIWYQGESNDSRALQYKQVFANMIASWRKEWQQGDFPFYFVQIAAHKDKTPQLRDSQTQVWQSVKNTGMVVAVDVGDSTNIHPRNKVTVGERLAFWALANDYGFSDVAFSGPLYKSMKTVGASILLSFNYTDGGLAAKDGNLREFMIAGPDKVFYPAMAIIRQNKVVVSSPQVRKPLYVRYAWENFMHPNLYNGKGLPAVPFRTDN